MTLGIITFSITTISIIVLFATIYINYNDQKRITSGVFKVM
jgi:hypothetical protein